MAKKKTTKTRLRPKVLRTWSVVLADRTAVTVQAHDVETYGGGALTFTIRHGVGDDAEYVTVRAFSAVEWRDLTLVAPAEP